MTLWSKTGCPKCGVGKLRLQMDAYSTYVACISCGARIPAQCPHCKTPSIAIDHYSEVPTVLCRSCECANGALASAVCQAVAVNAAVAG